MYLNLKSIILSKKLLLLSVTTAFLFTETKAQLAENYKADIEVQTIGTTNGVVPFWMRSNQFGSVPLSGISGSGIGRFSKSYDDSSNDDIYGRKKLTDWGFGLEGRANGGKNSNLQLIEAYVKGRLSIFQLKLGRTKDVMGLNGDTSLSSGNFAMSGNALGVPKIEISIPEFWRIPVFDGLFSFKGNFSHGWLGRVVVADTLGSAKGGGFIRSLNNFPSTFLHQKSFYGRLGKENWKFQLYGGFNHQVFWGNGDEIYGSDKFKLSEMESFIYVATGRAYGGKGGLTERSKIGNQLGSIDLGVDYSFENFRISLYRQNFYDVGALAKLANVRDGLNGISVQNLNYTGDDAGFHWEKMLFELFYSKDQAGYPWSIPTNSGDENYYNNYFYKEGWTYNGKSLGNPLITRREDAKKGQVTRPSDYFLNNRVVAIHLALKGNIDLWRIITKATYSWNYGTFGTSEYGLSTGPDRQVNTGPNFKSVQQFSAYLEGSRKLENGYTLGVINSFDIGGLLDESFGLALKLSKSF